MSRSQYPTDERKDVNLNIVLEESINTAPVVYRRRNRQQLSNESLWRETYPNSHGDLKSRRDRTRVIETSRRFSYSEYYTNDYPGQSTSKESHIVRVSPLGHRPPRLRVSSTVTSTVTSKYYYPEPLPPFSTFMRPGTSEIEAQPSTSYDPRYLYNEPELLPEITPEISAEIPLDLSQEALNRIPESKEPGLF